MVLTTITERGVVSAKNSVTIDSSINTAFNFSEGIAVDATYDSITLETGGSFTGKVIEITYSTGENQCRLITDMTGDVATVSPDWGIIPDSTSAYIIHYHSGRCPKQTQSNVAYHIKLDTGASSIDEFYTSACIKLLYGTGKGQIYKINNYTGSTREVCVLSKIGIHPLDDTLYAIYGESGQAQAGASSTITMDGNQSSVVKAKCYIELIGGLGQGQIRMISSISGDVITVSSPWTITPDNTTIYTIFGGWGSSEFENVLKYAIITVASDIDIHSGERAVLSLKSSMDTKGIASLSNLTELSSIMPSVAHAITVVSQFFRLKVISMGTTITGTIQTIMNSYKSGKITSRMEEPIHEYSDCDLTRAIIAGKTAGGQYQNVLADHMGRLSVSIKSPVDAFGSVMSTQPQQFAELLFLNNNINPAAIVVETLNTGTATTTNNIVHVSSGADIAGQVSVYSRRRMRYNPGLAVNVRFTAIFSTPIADSVQLIGYGDHCNGVFVGYDGIDFGILFRRGGAVEIRLLTITTISNINDTVTITLNGETDTVAILSTDNTQQIARKIALHSFAAVGCGWDVFEYGSTVLFVSRMAAPLSGTYAYTPTGTSAGTFSAVQSGVSPTDTWIYQNNWNIDRCMGNDDLPVINHQKGNVYSLGLQWLGFGNITVKVEHPELGIFQEIHQIRYSNRNVLTSLANPNLPLFIHVGKTGSDAVNDVTVKTASMALFVMGEPNKVLGSRLGSLNYYSTASGALTAGTYYNMLSIRNNALFNGQYNYNEVYIIALSCSLNSISSSCRGGVFTFFSQCLLDNSTTLTWTARNSIITGIDCCKNVVAISGGNELLSIPISVNQSFTQSTVDLELFVLPGMTVTCAFKPFADIPASPSSDTADISFSFMWVQR